MPRRIAGPEDAVRLAEHLLDPNRNQPVVVVTIPHGLDEPWIDATEIEQATTGLAEVVLLPTDDASWRFSEVLPEMTQVFGGAGRVYPVGLGWTRDYRLSPLRFAYSTNDSARATTALISDALRLSAKAGSVTARSARSIPAAGTVALLVPPSRAVVRLDGDGSLATVWSELTAADVPVDRLLAVGQALRGELDPDTRRLDVTGMLRDGAADLARYRPGDVVLGRVRAVRPDVVHLELHPAVVAAVPKDRVTGNPADSLTSLFTVGEVVAVRIAWLTDAAPALRLDDVDDTDEPVLAPALLDGGPPWLVPPTPPTWAEEPVPHEEVRYDDAAFRPVPGLAAPRVSPRPGPRPHPARGLPAEPATAPGLPTGPATAPLAAQTPERGAARDLSLSLDTARARVAALERELSAAATRRAAAESERDHLQRQVEASHTERQQSEEELQRMRDVVTGQRTALRARLQHSQKVAKQVREGEAVAAESAGTLFADPADQFRHEVYLEWAVRVSPEEKAQRPLSAYTLGPAFLTSLDDVQGVSRAKVVQVVVEVLIGRAEQLFGRDLHLLREGAGGDDSPLTRRGGWMCYRVALQRETPAARRLHYWRRGDEYELSRVVVHDDMAP